MFEGDRSGEELLTAAVDLLVDEVPATLPPTLALRRLAEMLQARERLQAAVLAAVRDLDVRELYALDGAGSARGWLRAQPGGEDGQLVLSRSLAARHQVSTALAEGRIAGRAAGQLCTALDKVPTDVCDDVLTAVLLDGVGGLLRTAEGGTPFGEVPASLLAARAAASAVLQRCVAATAAAPADRLEPALVVLAEQLTPNMLGWALRSLIDPLLPDGTDGRGEPDPYYLELRPLYDGDWDLRGLLDPETGQSLKAELDRRRSGRPEPTPKRYDDVDLFGLFEDVPEDAEDAETSPGPADGATSADDNSEIAADAAAQDAEAEAAADAFITELTAPRPDRDGTRICAGRLRHDALTQLLRDARQHRAGDGHAPTTCLTVTATLTTVLGQPGALPALLDHPGRPPVPISTETLHRLGCSAELNAVLLDAAGNPIGASSTRRSANRRERRALPARWGPTCAVKGCPSTLTVPHHAIPWWLSHLTTLEDLLPLCEHCHHDLHEGHRTLRLRDHRWIDERGWVARPATALAA